MDDSTVPTGSKCPTYAAMALFIDNERWKGVPFILKAGKALDEQKTEIRIQFNDSGNLFADSVRNELVIRIQPKESIYLKLMTKKPGLDFKTQVSELDLTYSLRFVDSYIPDAYEALILDCLKGDRENFVRSDELEWAWKIFTPILHWIDGKSTSGFSGSPVLQLYPYGSRGPENAPSFIRKYGFIRDDKYVWSPSTSNVKL